MRDIPRRPSHRSWAELAATGEAVSGFDDRPVLLVWGMRDWCFTPRFLDEWQRRLPSAEVEPFEHAGHYLFEDEAERYVARIASFLAETEARP